MDLIVRAAGDPNVSNGTCYFAQNSQTKGKFIPCGNSDLGAWACCYVGDYCLGFRGANACYDSSTGNTYLAGCTDSTFGSPACPSKHQFGSQEWVGITWCSEGTGSDDTAWGGCSVPNDLTTLQSLPHSSCDPYCATPIYTGGKTLTAYASLPTSAGGVIAYTSGFDPSAVYPITTTSTPRTTSTTRTTSAPVTTSTHTTTSSTTVTPSSTSPTRTTAVTVGISITTTSPQTSSSLPQSTSTQSASAGLVVGGGKSGGSGLSTGAIAGIGVGAAAGGLLLIGTILLALFFRRRSKKSLDNQQSTPDPGQNYGDAGDVVVAPRPWQGPNMSSTTYPSIKPELAGDAAYPPRQYPEHYPEHYPGHWANAGSGTPAYGNMSPELAAPESTSSRLSPSPYVSSGSPHSANAGYEHSSRVSNFSDSSTAQGENWRFVSS